eukprot:TCONS_00009128-protein
MSSTNSTSNQRASNNVINKIAMEETKQLNVNHDKQMRSLKLRKAKQIEERDRDRDYYKMFTGREEERLKEKQQELETAKKELEDIKLREKQELEGMKQKENQEMNTAENSTSNEGVSMDHKTFSRFYTKFERLTWGIETYFERITSDVKLYDSYEAWFADVSKLMANRAMYLNVKLFFLKKEFESNFQKKLYLQEVSSEEDKSMNDKFTFEPDVAKISNSFWEKGHFVLLHPSLQKSCLHFESFQVAGLTEEYYHGDKNSAIIFGTLDENLLH